ncbi:MAG: hypothetical protein HY356_05725 [Gammaproteobacteria bacterium]|nr:hypothetical protein [Gammaproteobacteria bacterium]
MRDCLKYDHCNAPICPLNNQESVHLKGEPVCFYFREYVKQGGKARLLGYLSGEMVEKISQRLPGILSLHSDIKKQLNQSAQTSSQIDALTRPRREAA